MPVLDTVTNEQELNEVVRLGEQFHREAKLPGEFSFDAAKATWDKFLAAGFGVIFTLREGDEVIGALGGILFPDPNSGELWATELFWYVKPEFRGSGLKLLAEFEAWAKHRGAKRITMVHLINSMPEKLHRIYTMRGYSPVEVHYIKELK